MTLLLGMETGRILLTAIVYPIPVLVLLIFGVPLLRAYLQNRRQFRKLKNVCRKLHLEPGSTKARGHWKNLSVDLACKTFCFMNIQLPKIYHYIPYTQITLRNLQIHPATEFHLGGKNLVAGEEEESMPDSQHEDVEDAKLDESFRILASSNRMFRALFRDPKLRAILTELGDHLILISDSRGGLAGRYVGNPPRKKKREAQIELLAQALRTLAPRIQSLSRRLDKWAKSGEQNPLTCSPKGANEILDKLRYVGYGPVKLRRRKPGLGDLLSGSLFVLFCLILGIAKSEVEDITLKGIGLTILGVLLGSLVCGIVFFGIIYLLYVSRYTILYQKGVRATWRHTIAWEELRQVTVGIQDMKIFPSPFRSPRKMPSSHELELIHAGGSVKLRARRFKLPVHQVASLIRYFRKTPQARNDLHEQK